jgi:hypothetical protein
MSRFHILEGSFLSRFGAYIINGPKGLKALLEKARKNIFFKALLEKALKTYSSLKRFWC